MSRSWPGEEEGTSLQLEGTADAKPPWGTALHCFGAWKDARVTEPGELGRVTLPGACEPAGETRQALVGQVK